MVIFNEFEKAGQRYKFLSKYLIRKYLKDEKYRDYFLYLLKFDCKGYVIGFSFRIISGLFCTIGRNLTVHYQTEENSFDAKNLISVDSIPVNKIFIEDICTEEAIDSLIGRIVETCKEKATLARKEADAIRGELSKKTHEAIFFGTTVTNWSLLNSKKPW